MPRRARSSPPFRTSSGPTPRRPSSDEIPHQQGPLAVKRLLAALAVVAACGAVAVPALAATRTVTLGDNFFRPKSLTVRKGATVRWVWRGKVLHNVTVKSGP